MNIAAAEPVNMNETIARIERCNNGFIVCADDPKIRKRNAKSDGRYTNPEQRYAFDKFSEVLKWLRENEENLRPEEDEFETAFNEGTEK